MTNFDENEWLSAWLAHAQGKQLDIKLPKMPAAEIQKLTNNKSGYETLKEAIPFYRTLSTAIKLHCSSQTPVILDLGAGWGRFSALLSQQGYDLHAVDVEPKLVEAGRRFLPEVTWSMISSNEPIDYPSATFDIVFSNSVFSHLSRSSHLHSVAEVARILKPGGIFVASTLTESNLKAMIKSEATRQWITGILGEPSVCFEKLADNEFVYGPTARWKDYGIAVITADWLEKHWSPYFKILDTIDDNPDKQSVTIAQKS